MTFIKSKKTFVDLHSYEQTCFTRLLLTFQTYYCRRT